VFSVGGPRGIENSRRVAQQQGSKRGCPGNTTGNKIKKNSGRPSPESTPSSFQRAPRRGGGRGGSDSRRSHSRCRLGIGQSPQVKSS
jgi:hypothetical protein